MLHAHLDEPCLTCSIANAVAFLFMQRVDRNEALYLLEPPRPDWLMEQLPNCQKHHRNL